MILRKNLKIVVLCDSKNKKRKKKLIPIQDKKADFQATLGFNFVFLSIQIAVKKKVSFLLWDIVVRESFRYTPYIKEAKVVFMLTDKLESLKTWYDVIEQEVNSSREKIKTYFIDIDNVSEIGEIKDFLTEKKINILYYGDKTTDKAPYDSLKIYLLKAYEDYYQDYLKFAIDDLAQKKLLTALNSNNEKEIFNNLANALEKNNKNAITQILAHKKICIEKKELITNSLIDHFKNTKNPEYIFECFKSGTTLNEIFSEPRGFGPGLFKKLSKNFSHTDFNSGEFKKLQDAIYTFGDVEIMEQFDQIINPHVENTVNSDLEPSKGNDELESFYPL